MEIIDSQVHILDEDKPERPWDPNFGAAAGQAREEVLKHFTKGSAITTDDKMLEAMDAVGVNKALLVATSHYGWDNSYSLESAEKAPDRFRVIGRINHDAEDVADQVAEWKAQEYGVGLRLLIMSDEHHDRFQAGYMDPVIIPAREHGIPLCIFAPGRSHVIGSLARRYSDLQLVVDHLGLAQPPLMKVGPDPFADLAEVLRLGRFPNVAIKLSAAPTLSSEKFPFNDLWPHLHKLFEKFGADRLMWGSDWTRVDSLYSNEDGLKYITETSELSDSEKEQVLGKSLRNIFDWAD